MSSFFNCVFFIDKSRGLFSFISDHRSDVVGFQFVAAVKPGEFQKKYNFFHDSAKFFYQFGASFHRTAGSDQVIYDNDFLTFGNGIFVKFDLGGAVFQLITCTDGFTRQFAFLRHGTKPFPRAYAIAEPKINPRASSPTTRSKSKSFTFSIMASIAR